MTDKIIEIMAWEAYCSHCATDPIDPNKQPSRREFKVQAVVWLAVAQAALKAIQDSGCAVVPVEPTQGMVTVMNRAGIDPYHVYSEAIRAAQKEE